MRLAFVSTLTFALAFSACGVRPNNDRPSAVGLPNGWRISPVGHAVATNPQILRLQRLPQGRIAALHSGFTAQGVLTIDTATETVTQSLPLRSAWLGMDYDAASRQLFVSGGNEWTAAGSRSPIYAFSWHNNLLAQSQRMEPLPESLTSFASWSGLAIDGKRNRLYAADRGSGDHPGHVVIADSHTGRRLGAVAVGLVPYETVLSPDGSRLFVSNWSGKSVSIVDPLSARELKRVPVGANPNAMVLSSDGRLFVACSAADTVVTIDANTGDVLQTISTRLYPRAPNGSTPNALALDARRNILYVANADNNALQVIDVADRTNARVLGFVPTGWYPSALALTEDGAKLVIACAKGEGSKPTPRGPYSPLAKRIEGDESIKTVLGGMLYFVGTEAIRTHRDEYTALVRQNSPYYDSLLDVARVDASSASIVPSRHTAGSPVQHVVYIIKENRTYDQLLGDMPEGNGDKSLAIFGRQVTPNHHALALQYGLFDNYYVDGEVSADGHQWSNAAYATDYTEKQWPARYALFSRQLPAFEYSPAKIPPAGYLWDLCARKGLTYRSYGEFADRWHQTRNEVPTANVPALEGHLADGYDLITMRDTDNARYFLRELTEFETHFKDAAAARRLPAYTVLILGEDHTFGTAPGKPSPRACVANNDLALGQIVDRLTHSPYWPKMAVFITEDDAQDGPDHVDGHRSLLLTISPYSTAGLHHQPYTTSSILRTIELLLGLPPMTQYDAAAMPLYAAFGTQYRDNRYKARPAEFDVNQVNEAMAWGSRESLAMDFSNYDRAPEDLLNEIIWRSVRGAAVPMPHPKSTFGSEDDE
ncbi:MAG: bifunctional YncE family protein/alkaline phosphatase family protein [Bryobacteraceae bacterium]